MLAVQLAHLPGGPFACDIHLVEPRPALGPGLAYTARRPEYLLNVRSALLSAFPDQPGHFAEWLRSTNAPACEQDFCARQTYGRYIQEQVASVVAQQAANGMRVTAHNTSATAATLAADGQSAVVELADGTRLESHYVVLALGNFPPLPPTRPSEGYSAHPGFHGNPWAQGALRTIGLDDSVLLIGSGLTAVDVLLGLRADGHRAPITVVSGHGRWPTTHGPVAAPYPSFYASDLQQLTTVAEVMAAVRRRVRKAAAEGIDWRSVVDSLRPDLGRIWANCPLPEQARFLRHVSSLWTTIRHRSPPQNAATIESMMAAGQVQVHRGRVCHLAAQGAELAVQVRQKHDTTVLTAQHVVSCTGPLLDYTRIQDPLVQSMRAAGQLVPDVLRLGMETDEHGALRNTVGIVSPVFFTLGPSRRPAYFESTAVPELRQQAVALAQLLGQRVAD
ncbi:hypothetical protein AM218_03110 [Hymenobacter sp. DG25A]|nr:hypothetical protein AM218_03110 [Hymenobacter sp. DG25A]